MKLNKTVELLAPAKDKETAIAAVNAGADAIYIGAVKFGARQNASNSLEDIKEIVDYAHKFNVRVHVTLNTILSDDELKEAEKLVHKLYEIGVDALIVQDMGILGLAIEGKLPPVELHASTQCNNRTLEKVKFFQNTGVKRVILARELTLSEIEHICEEVRNSDFNPDMEIEVFVHGALCVSYSGQCYLSASIGGRSANRGECAQPCRKKYSLADEDGKIYAKEKYLLNLKDFNASKHIERLINAGVKSFKIEGRLKDSGYVKNVTAFYRKELDKFALKSSSGKSFTDFEPDLSKSFNRGFTDYFLPSVTPDKKGRRKNINNFDTPKSLGEKIGRVEKLIKGGFILDGAKLNPQDGLCYFSDGELLGCLVNIAEGNKIYLNNPGKIKEGTVIYRNFNSEFDRILKNSKTARKIGVKFVLKDKILTAADEDGNTAQVHAASGEPPKNPDKMRLTLETQLAKTGESDFYAESIEILGIPDFMPVSVVNEMRRKILSELSAKRLENYKRPIQTPLKYAKFPIETYDYHANVLNETAKQFYKNCGCEITEDALEKTHDFKGKELMCTKYCLKFAFNLCGVRKNLFLTDEKGKKYPLKFDCKNCRMIIQG